MVYISRKTKVNSSGIIWQPDSWAFDCLFDKISYEKKEETISLEKCSSQCYSSLTCQHFSWYDDKCKMNFDSANEATSFIDNLCGIKLGNRIHLEF